MKSNKRFVLLGLCAAIAAGTAGQAQACGEVMYRMGGALRYHAFITRHPAEILLYSDAEQSPGANRDEFHHNLEKAGHKVTAVYGTEALAHALADGHYDVIITYAKDVPTINAQLAHAQREPSLIPVFQSGDDAMRKQYPLALNDDANINQFLKTIEQTMKTRGT
jgi:hypothetical protein